MATVIADMSVSLPREVANSFPHEPLGKAPTDFPNGAVAPPETPITRARLMRRARRWPRASARSAPTRGTGRGIAPARW